jgi:hypothetical protein
MISTLNWQPEPTLAEQILRLAQQRGQPPEAILTEAILLYLENQLPPNSIQNPPEAIDSQPDLLIGLFSGAADLATRAEDILEQEITPQSGWTWKS